MKKEWQVKRLGDLSDLITKGTTPTSIGYAFVPEGINFVKVESISENGQFRENKLARITQECHNALRRSQLKPGDILFSIAGALGRTAFVTDNIIPANTNQALAIIRLKKSDDVSSAFVLKALSTGIVLEQIEKFRGGVAQQNLSLAQVRDFQIALPPLTEQQRIVGILDEAFGGIATAKVNAEKNLQNARELFASHLNSVFTKRGERWVEKPLNELVDLIMGQAPSSKDCNFDGQGTPFVKVGEFGELRPLIREWTTNPLRMARCTDVLLCVVGATCGKINLGEDCAIGRSVAALRPNVSKLNQFYFYYFMMTLVEKLRSGSVGAAQTVISKEMLKNIQIPFVSLPEQQRIVEQLDSLRAETKCLESIYKQKLTALDELKKSLLNQAFTGKL